ncbi:helix-hairpin-helix domain-containing protein [Streptomyces sp. NPDC059862]|uniref:helix-hairpin-helix domain-containing protein n=1 Tax=Streptomyces sp. NPDC059862 TaxID=3346975 RepID=UPI00365096C9
MALRSRTRAASVTSGPGRGPASDGRTLHRHRHHRRRPPARGRSRSRHGSAEELRRRAEVLFAERAGEWRESGAGPPVEERSSSGEARGPEANPGGEETSTAPVGAGAGSWRERAGLAVRERMPLWLQARCGLERRSVLALTVVLVVAAGFAVQHFWTGRTQSVQAPEVVKAAAPYGVQEAEPAASGSPPGPAGATGTPVAEIVVDVSGKVREPGIHRLPAGSRVADALRAAGGVRPGTDIDGLNRARLLVDGEQVVVGGPPPVSAPGAPAGVPAGAAPGVPAGPVSLNTATVEQLDTLPGVGPVLAQHIIDYRTQHGGFRSVDELREVNGIGERRFADLRDLVRP